MVNTEGSPVFLEKFDAGLIAPHDDAYTVRDGHFRGHDGFIVPSNFSEFYQRFPTYVADWVRRRVRDCASATEAEDWTQELLLHLAALPPTSKHRSAGKEDLRQAGRRIREREEHRFRLEEFVNRTADAIPGLKDVFEFFRITGNCEETAKMFGRRKCASIRWRIQELGKA